jgi:photosystem II stability/assembly factor-like uncharacterized protein
MPGPACVRHWGKPMADPGSSPPGGPAPKRPGQPGGALDEWLSAQVTPLPPPPGTLERIRKRARRRKLTRAVGSAAGAAVLALGLAVLPRLALSQLHPAVRAPSAVSSAVVPRPRYAPGSRHLRPASPAGQSAGAVPAVPPNFAPTSVTFVGTATGWVIGQAGQPGHCGPPDPRICTSIARTDDGGRTWRGVPAPVAGPPDGGNGVSQLRFLNTTDGWAFGPQLWATHDGGQHWTEIGTHGLRVTALETSGTAVYAVWARCHGGGARFAAGCTSFMLYSSPAGSDHWRPVPGAAAGLTAGGVASAAQLVLAGRVGYLLPPSGVLLTGPLGQSGRWLPAAPGLLNAAPCQPAAPGRPGALVAAAAPGHLALLCPGSSLATAAARLVYESADGGRTWRLAGQDRVPGVPASLAATPDGVLVAGTSQGIDISTGSGAAWRPARVTAAPSGGFSYVGMTTAAQGVALAASPGQHAVWFTYDGGLTWRPSAIR